MTPPGRAWNAIWGPDQPHLYWQLTITDEGGNIALGPERTGACYPGPRPLDLYLKGLGLTRTGDWVPGSHGTFAAPVTADERLEARLLVVVERFDSGHGSSVDRPSTGPPVTGPQGP